nr:hypothetical protein Iba_chr01fCG8980 [Ipomoea batatas]
MNSSAFTLQTTSASTSLPVNDEVDSLLESLELSPQLRSSTDSVFTELWCLIPFSASTVGRNESSFEPFPASVVWSFSQEGRESAGSTAFDGNELCCPFSYKDFFSQTVPGNTMRLTLLKLRFSLSSKGSKPKPTVHVSTKLGIADTTSFSTLKDFSIWIHNQVNV